MLQRSSCLFGWNGLPSFVPTLESNVYRSCRENINGSLSSCWSLCIRFFGRRLKKGGSIIDPLKISLPCFLMKFYVILIDILPYVSVQWINTLIQYSLRRTPLNQESTCSVLREWIRISHMGHTIFDNDDPMLERVVQTWGHDLSHPLILCYHW